MAQLVVTVDKLNKRTAIPVTLSDKSSNDSVVEKGFRFEGFPFVNTATNGKKWYKDREGFFYWAGGLMEEATTVLPHFQPAANSYFAESPILTNWNARLKQVPADWKRAGGQGVKVAVLDTGIFKDHEDIKTGITLYQDFTAVKDEIDYSGHGTHVAGIIGARSNAINGLIGVAPKCELIILKVLGDEKDIADPDNFNNIIDALDVAVSSGADIVNMSFSLQTNRDNPTQEWKDSLEALKNKIAALSAMNILLIAAAGDKADLKEGRLFFPASEKGVLSVAAINEGYLDRHNDVSASLNIVGPFVNYFSTYIPPKFYEALPGCSMCTAFLSGIVALCISVRKMNGATSTSRAELLNLLNSCSIQPASFDYRNSDEFYFNLLNITS